MPVQVRPHLIGQHWLPSLKEVKQFSGTPYCAASVRCRKRINADLKVGQVKRYRSPRYLLKALGQPDGRDPVFKGLLKFTCPLYNEHLA